MFDFLKKNGTRFLLQNAIPYGGTKRDGSHDHRTNRGRDRTVAQREGDLKRTRGDSGK